MGEKSNQITRDIEEQRAQLGSNLEELEGKVKDIADWRQQFQNSPLTMMGLALGGGILLSSVLGGRRSRTYYAPRRDAGRQWRDETSFGREETGFRESDKATHNQLRRASATWDTIKGALIGVAAGSVKNLLTEAVPGFTEEFHKVQAREHPQLESERRPETPRVAAD
jgi:hypothetical protein